MSRSAPLNPQGTICHIRFSVPDLEEAKAFYGELFGWEFHPFGEGKLFFEAPAPGPTGSIKLGTPNQTPRSFFFVTVDNIEKTLEKAEALGATVDQDKDEIHGALGYTARLRSPEGNIIGLYCPT
jgi:predicted enzyme related to lactoylglutathione lyase